MKNSFFEIQQIRRGSIYHYTSCEALINIIQQREFWVTSSNYLNDSKEIYYIEKVIKEVSSDLLPQDKDNNFYNNLIRCLEKYLPGDLQRFILSFSESADSLTLWSEFSNFYGYSIEFDIEGLRRYFGCVNEIKLCTDGRVIYNFETQKTIIQHEFQQIIDGINEEEEDADKKITWYDFSLDKNDLGAKKESIDEFYLRASSKLKYYSAFFKDCKFENEAEYRFVFEFANEEYKKRINFREKFGVILPYVKLYQEQDKEQRKNMPIKGIIIGAKNYSDLAVSGIKNLLQQNKYNIDEKDIKKSTITLRY